MDTKRWWRLDGLTWYVLFIIALLSYLGLTGRLDTSPKPVEKSSIPSLAEAEKNEISDRYKQAIAEITANYQKHYHKDLLPHEGLSIYMKCKTDNIYPPILRKGDEHLIEYICPPKDLLEMTQTEKHKPMHEQKS